MTEPSPQITIPSQLYHYEFNNLEELRSRLAQRYEDKNEAIWEICDMCAVARRMVPYTRTGGTVDRRRH